MTYRLPRDTYNMGIVLLFAVATDWHRNERSHSLETSGGRSLSTMKTRENRDGDVSRARARSTSSSSHTEIRNHMPS